MNSQRFQSAYPKHSPYLINIYILIPSSTNENIRFIFLKFHRKKTIIMSWFMPFNSCEIIFDLLSLLVINSNYVVFTCCTKWMSIRCIINCHNIISFLISCPNLFSCFSCILIKMSICVTNKQNCWCCAIHFVGWPPSQSIYWSWLLRTGIHLSNLIIRSKIEYSDETVTISTSSHRVLIVEASDHELCIFLNNCLHEQLIFEGNLLDYSALAGNYLWNDFEFLLFIE